MWVPEMLGGVEWALRAAGSSSRLGGSGDRREQEAEQIERLVGQDVAGLILYPVDGASNAPLRRRLRADGLPIILVDRYLPELEVDAVVADASYHRGDPDRARRGAHPTGRIAGDRALTRPAPNRSWDQRRPR